MHTKNSMSQRLYTAAPVLAALLVGAATVPTFAQGGTECDRVEILEAKRWVGSWSPDSATTQMPYEELGSWTNDATAGTQNNIGVGFQDSWVESEGISATMRASGRSNGLRASGGLSHLSVVFQVQRGMSSTFVDGYSVAPVRMDLNVLLNSSRAYRWGRSSVDFTITRVREWPEPDYVVYESTHGGLLQGASEEFVNSIELVPGIYALNVDVDAEAMCGTRSGLSSSQSVSASATIDIAFVDGTPLGEKSFDVTMASRKAEANGSASETIEMCDAALFEGGLSGTRSWQYSELLGDGIHGVMGVQAQATSRRRSESASTSFAYVIDVTETSYVDIQLEGNRSVSFGMGSSASYAITATITDTSNGRERWLYTKNWDSNLSGTRNVSTMSSKSLRAGQYIVEIELEALADRGLFSPSASEAGGGLDFIISYR